MLARPALQTPKVLIIDEPTQGVDAKARLDIYQRDHATPPTTASRVLVNSSDSGELAGLCDRVYVMSRGDGHQGARRALTESEIVRSFVSATDVRDASGGTSSLSNEGAFGRLFSRAGAIPADRGAAPAHRAGRRLHGVPIAVFWSSFNLANLLVLTLPLAFVALGQQFTMIAGLFDISVGSVMSLAVVLVSMTLPDLSASSIAATLACSRWPWWPSAGSTPS